MSARKKEGKSGKIEGEKEGRRKTTDDKRKEKRKIKR